MKISALPMIIQRTLYLIIITLTLVSCNNFKDKSNKNKHIVEEVFEDAATTEDLLLQKVIEAHGGQLYHQANFSFRFRKKEYTFSNSDYKYTYTVKSVINTDTIIDVLENDTFNRFINDRLIELTEKEIAKYSEALNSVIYFATLPHKLNDPAVIKTYRGTTTINREDYEILQITFTQDGGGTDFDDVFYYWINQETYKIDYLAYNYRINGGGVRFRSAYNRRVVSGITFQDYVNYKAPIETPLSDLPSLLEQDKLKELSRIETENIIDLKN